LHVVDFGQCENWLSPLKRLLFRWQEHFDVNPRSEMTAVLSACAKQHEMKFEFEKSHSGYVYRAALSR
jgi:hypothetical protein